MLRLFAHLHAPRTPACVQMCNTCMQNMHTSHTVPRVREGTHLCTQHMCKATRTICWHPDIHMCTPTHARYPHTRIHTGTLGDTPTGTHARRQPQKYLCVSLWVRGHLRRPDSFNLLPDTLGPVILLSRLFCSLHLAPSGMTSPIGLHSSLALCLLPLGDLVWVCQYPQS